MAYEYKVKLCIRNPKITNTLEHHVYNFKLPEDGTFIFDAKDGVINTTFTRVDNLHATIILNFREMQQSFTTKMAEHTFLTRNYVKIIGNVLKSYSYFWIIKREILGEGYSTDSIYDEQFSMKCYLKLDILKTVLELPNPYMNRNADVIVRAQHNERFKKSKDPHHEGEYVFDFSQRNNNRNLWSKLVEKQYPLVVDKSIEPTQSWEADKLTNMFSKPVNGLFWYGIVGDQCVTTLDGSSELSPGDYFQVDRYNPGAPFMGYAIPLAGFVYEIGIGMDPNFGVTEDPPISWKPSEEIHSKQLLQPKHQGSPQTLSDPGVWGDITFFGCGGTAITYVSRYNEVTNANVIPRFREFQKANAASGATIVGVPIPYKFPREATVISHIEKYGGGHEVSAKGNWLGDWVWTDGSISPTLKADLVPIRLAGTYKDPSYWAWAIILGINSTNINQSHYINWKNVFDMPYFKKSDIVQSIRNDREPQLLLPPFREVNLIYSGKPPINLQMLSYMAKDTTTSQKEYSLNMVNMSIFQMITPKEVTFQTVFTFVDPIAGTSRKALGEYEHFGADFGKMLSIKDFPQMDVTSNAYMTLMQQHRNSISTSQSVAEANAKLAGKWSSINAGVSGTSSVFGGLTSVAKSTVAGAAIGSVGGPIGAGAGAVIGATEGVIGATMGVLKAALGNEQNHQQINLQLKNQMATIQAPLKDAMNQPETTTYSMGGEDFFNNLFKHNIIHGGGSGTNPEPMEAKKIFQIQIRNLMYVEQKEVWLQYKKYGAPCHYVRTFASPKDFKTRQNFNYWRIEDAWKMYDPRILSKQARDELSKIFGEGVTMWHNKDMILNYVMPNPELSIVEDTL